MTAPDALRAAVCAAPADDLPRLVFADWLDDHGQADRAAFVRAQCRLAATDPWEPFAVLCRHRRPEWVCGDRWYPTLPRVDGHAIEWHPDYAFRRGFGWAVIVRDLAYFLEQAPRLFSEAPVGELHLPGRATAREQWQALAAADWFRRVEVVHFYGTSAPIEPVRAICETPHELGLREVVFQSASSPAMPGLLGDLLASPAGRRLKRLGLRVGPTDPDELFEQLLLADYVQLDRLSLTTFGGDGSGQLALYHTADHQEMTELELENVSRVHSPFTGSYPVMQRLARLRLIGSALTTGLGTWRYTAGLKALEIDRPTMSNGSPLGIRATIPSVGAFAGLASLALRGSHIPDRFVRRWIVPGAFWPNLVELDLRDNVITDAGAKHLLAAPVPPDLTALLLDGNPISPAMLAALRGHFGDALILSENPPPG